MLAYPSTKPDLSWLPGHSEPREKGLISATASALSLKASLEWRDSSQKEGRTKRILQRLRITWILNSTDTGETGLLCKSSIVVVVLLCECGDVLGMCVYMCVRERVILICRLRIW